MNNIQSAELLERYNIWRRGDDTYAMENPKELGIALELAIKALREQPATITFKMDGEEFQIFTTGEHCAHVKSEDWRPHTPSSCAVSVIHAAVSATCPD